MVERKECPRKISCTIGRSKERFINQNYLQILPIELHRCEISSMFVAHNVGGK